MNGRDNKEPTNQYEIKKRKKVGTTTNQLNSEPARQTFGRPMMTVCLHRPGALYWHKPNRCYFLVFLYDLAQAKRQKWETGEKNKKKRRKREKQEKTQENPDQRQHENWTIKTSTKNKSRNYCKDRLGMESFSRFL